MHCHCISGRDGVSRVLGGSDSGVLGGGDCDAFLFLSYGQLLLMDSLSLVIGNTLIDEGFLAKVPAHHLLYTLQVTNLEQSHLFLLVPLLQVFLLLLLHSVLNLAAFLSADVGINALLTGVGH